MYKILNRSNNRLTIEFQNHIYTDVFASSNEDRCIKLFLRKKLFGKLDLNDEFHEQNHSLKEINNIQYCFLDLIDRYVLQTKLQEYGFNFINTCLPRNEDDIYNFVTNKEYIIRPCINSECNLPYYNKIYTSSTQILNDLKLYHRWKDIQNSISYRVRNTAHRYSKFVIQEYFVSTDETIDTTTNHNSLLVDQIIKTFKINYCDVFIDIKNNTFIDNIRFHNLKFERLKRVNSLEI
jgi:hypothetical protein